MTPVRSGPRINPSEIAAQIHLAELIVYELSDVSIVAILIMRTIRYINNPRPRQMFLQQFPLPPIRQVLFEFNWALFDYCPPLEGV